MSDPFDLIIAGGGIVGCTLAVALAEQGLSIALVDAALTTQPTPSAPAPVNALSNPRVSAIYTGARRALKRLGGWPDPKSKSVPEPEHATTNPGSEFRCMTIWESANRAGISFDSASIGQPDLGSIIDNQLLVSALRHRLESARITLIESSVTAISYPDINSVALQLEHDEQLATRLLVGADGTESTVRRLARIDISRRDYHQQAVVARVKPLRDHQQTAWQKFLPAGPVALLPLAEGYCSIVWSTSPEHAERLVQQPDAEFCRELGDAIDGELGTIIETSPRQSFDLFRQHARRYVGPHIALIGDAAHRVHPLAGMGANLGIADALALAELIIERPADPGSGALLSHYDSWRRSEASIYINAQEALRSCYRWSGRPATELRGLGVRLLNRSGLIKAELLLQSVGLAGHLPRIMRTQLSE